MLHQHGKYKQTESWPCYPIAILVFSKNKEVGAKVTETFLEWLVAVVYCNVAINKNKKVVAEVTETFLEWFVAVADCNGCTVADKTGQIA